MQLHVRKLLEVGSHMFLFRLCMQSVSQACRQHMHIQTAQHTASHAQGWLLCVHPACSARFCGPEGGTQAAWAGNRKQNVGNSFLRWGGMQSSGYPGSFGIICEKVAVEGVSRFEDRFRLPVGISVNMTSFAAKLLTQVLLCSPICCSPLH